MSATSHLLPSLEDHIEICPAYDLVQKDDVLRRGRNILITSIQTAINASQLAYDSRTDSDAHYLLIATENAAQISNQLKTAVVMNSDRAQLAPVIQALMKAKSRVSVNNYASHDPSSSEKSALDLELDALAAASGVRYDPQFRQEEPVQMALHVALHAADAATTIRYDGYLRRNYNRVSKQFGNVDIVFQDLPIGSFGTQVGMTDLPVYWSTIEGFCLRIPEVNRRRA